MWLSLFPNKTKVWKYDKNRWEVRMEELKNIVGVAGCAYYLFGPIFFLVGLIMLAVRRKFTVGIIALLFLGAIPMVLQFFVILSKMD